MPYRDPEKRRAAGREALRRWRQRHGKEYVPRRRQLDRERYAANRESVLSAKRQRYASDPTFANIVRAQNRDWYERNREKRRAYNLRYRQEHGDELRARDRARNRWTYAQDPRAALDYYKQWRLRNLERARAYVRVSSHNVVLRAPEATSRLRSGARYSPRTKGTAHIAARPSASRPITGFRSIAAARTRSANILPACRHCNRRKHRRTEEEFRSLLQAERASALLRSPA